VVRRDFVVDDFVAQFLYAANRVVADDVVDDVDAVAPRRGGAVGVEGEAVLLQVLGQYAACSLHLAVGAVVVEVAGDDDGLACLHPSLCRFLDNRPASAPGTCRQSDVNAGEDVAIKLGHEHTARFKIGRKADDAHRQGQLLAQDAYAVAGQGAAEDAVHAGQFGQLLHLIFVVGTR